MQPEPQTSSWLDRPIFFFLPGLSAETFLVSVILLLAVASRLYDLGARVISFDEVNHVVPAYDLYQGRGYRYDPMTHGPLQFHMMALSFFMLGDSDTSARIPAALFGIGAIVFVLFAYRRFLGRAGALVAGFLLLISPYMLFYSRYTRNEIYTVFWATALIYAVLAYVENGKTRFLFLFALITAMHFIDKATSYIFAAEMMLFLVLFFLSRVLRQKWQSPRALRSFIYTLLAAIVFAGLAIGFYFTGKAPIVTSAVAAQVTLHLSILNGLTPLAGAAFVAGLAGAIAFTIAALVFLIKGLGWQLIRKERSFDLIILQATLVLPLSAALLIKTAGFDPTNYTSAGLITSGLFILPLLILAAAIGLWWRPKTWFSCMTIFWSIFIVFYSTFFTNLMGIPTGLVGALGYWSAQQSVERGSQPLYYYILVQIPTYEFLPFLGALLAIAIGIRHKLWMALPGAPFRRPVEELQSGDAKAGSLDEPLPEANVPEPLAQWLVSVKQAETLDPEPSITTDRQPVDEVGEPENLPLNSVPTLTLLIFWSISSIVTFSVAGERMPWLTVDMALPLILAAGWGLGYLIETTHWAIIRQLRGWLILPIALVFVASFAGALIPLLGANPPFHGDTIDQLQSTSIFLTSLVALVISSYGLLRLLGQWQFGDVLRVSVYGFFAFLAVLTIRTSIRAAYINDDTAMEFLVYAHMARGPKDALAQIEELSYRTTGGKDIVIAYDNDVNYPFWWYLRDYPNRVYIGDKPTNDLRNYPIVAVDDEIFSKVDTILGDAYNKVDYMRLWWPIEDYKGLTWDRLRYAITDPKMRDAIFQIWFNRNYQPYADLEKRTDLTLTTWQPSHKMRLYIRKDILNQVWKDGAVPAAQPAQADPYSAGKIPLSADAIVGAPGANPGQWNAPRQIAVAPDGSLYVADSRNNRIQHLSADGKSVIAQWGTFADVSKGNAPGGTFYEPWGVAVGPDGSVYVADTWNNRIQKFTADGKFVSMWGYFGEAEKPEAFWGPRGLAFDSKGQLFVTDTGNKRVVVFDGNGKYVTQFGTAGSDAGQFNEPVGVAVDKDGKVYVADTWNQRVQVMAPDAAGLVYTSALNWTVQGWLGQSVENKPYLTVDGQEHVYVTDPEGCRVLEFKTSGEFVHTWGDCGADDASIGETSGIAADTQGTIWVSDAVNNRLVRFAPPVQ